MKCPKCGYLGFETTERCRNCQYDFSLAPFAHESELTLRDTRKTESSSDFELPSIQRPADQLSATALDLDRLFGDANPADSAHVDVSGLAENGAGHHHPSEPVMLLVDEGAATAVPLEIAAAPAMMRIDPEGGAQTEPDVAGPPAIAAVEKAPPPPVPPSSDDDTALPFDEAPIVPPPAARPPLAVRRSTPDVPRNRPRTTRPVRADSLNLESASTASVAREASDTIDSLLESPSLGVRVAAGVIDLMLLVGIDAAILFLTLKVTGLQSTLEDLRVLPPVPFVGFLALLAFGYVAAFTVAGGQTIGKMMLSLRVIGDDGRPIDAAGGMLRALGCMLVPATLGLSYLPALFTSDHRAIHDRLAGTRVVQE